MAEVTPRRILKTLRTRAQLFEVHIDGQVILSTSRHPFYVVGEGWIPANRLQPGDMLVGHNHVITHVSNTVPTDEWTTVYNFTIAEDHTFFIAHSHNSNTIWVHNGCDWEVHLVNGELHYRRKLADGSFETRKPGDPGYDNAETEFEAQKQKTKANEEGAEESGTQAFGETTAPRVDVVRGEPRTNWVRQFPKHRPSARLGPTTLIDETMLPPDMDIASISRRQLDELNAAIDDQVQYFNRYNNKRAKGNATVADFNNVPKEPGAQQLPIQPDGYYVRTDIFPKKHGVRRGQKYAGVYDPLITRLVHGKNGEVFVTFDHYRTFVRIR